MKYAVLGATGLLGHHAARAIRAAGHDLVLIHRPSSQIQRLAYLEPECRVAEMLDHAGLERALRGLDGVIFSAGYYPSRPRRWQEEVASALGQTNPFYAACLQARVPRILYVGSAYAMPRHPQGLPGHEGLFYDSLPSGKSSYVLCKWALDEQARVPRILYVGSAYAMPRHPQGLPGHEGLFYDSLPSGKSSYVLCKWALDEQAREQARNGLPVVIGIPGMVLGELDIGPTTGRVITAIGNGEMTHYVAGQRNVIDAAEAGRGLLMALERGRIGERYLLTGHNLEMADLTRRIAELLGQPAPQPMSMAMARALATLGRLRYRVSGQLPLLDETAIEVMAGGQFLDGRKAREELGFFSTTALDDTLLRAIDWFRDNGYFNA
ncbi:TPA: NAD-dependent epimerase/dehydratase family protein [Pseudomonas aeruginosa]|nr:NAD-dependent epimerase/dehydratase family protein [Pseudomonas aeruginosa]HDV6168084.1 NAD-dependent epimerase/dehydratase family protein [Pseudomonas aeruginosa]